MTTRFDGERGERLCVECESPLAADEGVADGHCEGCADACQCDTLVDRLDQGALTAEDPEHTPPSWLRSGRHG